MTVTPLVTKEAAKAHLRVDHTDEDVLITALVASASEMVSEMVGLPVGSTEKEVTVADGSGFFMLPDLAVTSLVSVKAGGAALTGFTLSYEGDRAMVSGPWPAGEVVVTYTYGLTNATLATAALLMIGHWYQQREAVSDKPFKEVPLAVESLVSLHRRGWMKA